MPPKKAPICKEAAILYGAKIGLPDTEVEKWYDYYEANGWHVGKVPMRSPEAALRNWFRNWRERQQWQQKRSNSPPIWKQIKDLEDSIRRHKANPSYVAYKREQVTEAMKKDLTDLRLRLDALKNIK